MCQLFRQLPFSLVIPTQNELRYPVHKSDFRYDGITLVQTEDSKLYLWNGHHRCISMLKAGISYLESWQFKITQFTYEQLLTINYDVEYYTPFDPRIECRKDFLEFKRRCNDIYDQFGFADLFRFIKKNENLYKEERKISNLEELCNL